MSVIHGLDPQNNGANNYRGLFDASGGILPALPVAVGDFWLVNVQGIIDGVRVNIGDRIVANDTITQNALWCGEWVLIDTRDMTSTAIIDSDGNTFVTTDSTDSNTDLIVMTAGGTPAATLAATGRLTLSQYPTYSDATTASALYIDATGEVKYGAISGATTARIQDAANTTFVSTADTADTVIITALCTNAANFSSTLAEIVLDTKLTAYPNTRNDGSATSALYTDAAGNLLLGPIANQHVAATFNDGNSIDFTVSGTDNQTVTAEITGIGAAASSRAFLADGSGSGAWGVVALDQTAIFDGPGTTKVATAATANTITMLAGGTQMLSVALGNIQIGAAATDTTTIRGDDIRLTDIPTVDSNSRALYTSGLNNTVKLGYIDTLADSDGNTKIQVEKTSNNDTINFDTAGVERAKLDSNGLQTSFDVEITDTTKGIIMVDSLGTRWRMTINTDGSLKMTSL